VSGPEGKIEACACYSAACVIVLWPHDCQKLLKFQACSAWSLCALWVSEVLHQGVLNSYTLG